MRFWRSIPVITLAIFLFSAASNAQVFFDETVTFGDSLTHNDILGLVYGNPQDLYGNDPAQAAFNKGRASGDNLTNYAIAGNESKDIPLQLDFYDLMRRIFVQEKATLINFEIGGNDMLNNVGLLANNAPGENNEADAVVNRYLTNVRRDLLRLARSHRGYTQVILWTVPDITFTPAEWFLDDWQKDNLKAHIEKINRRLRSLDRFSDVAVFDLAALLRDLALDPPIINGQQLVGPPAYGDYDHVFADEIHPTAVSNAIIANAIIAKINAKWNDNIPFYTEDELAALAHLN